MCSVEKSGQNIPKFGGELQSTKNIILNKVRLYVA
jgi:hypothetical protein